MGLVSLLTGSHSRSSSSGPGAPRVCPRVRADVVVLGPEPDRDAHWTDAAPVLVIEVTSPDAVVQDWVRNMRHHARFGARDWWILDHRDHTR